MDNKTKCPHCGKPLTSTENLSAPASEQPTLEGKERSELRGLTVVSFLSALGLLLLPVGFLSLFLLRFGSIPGLAPCLIIGGLILILAGPVGNDIIVRRSRRRKKTGSKSAPATQIAGLVGILAIVGTILIPVRGFNRSDGDNRTWALSGCREISTALLLFHKDTGTWPIYTSADHSPEARVDCLYGNMGEMPKFKEGEVRKSWGGRSEDMYFTLVTNGRNGPWCQYGHSVPNNSQGRDRIPTGGWAGPYLRCLNDDPWGYAYLISVSGFEGGTKPDSHVWCLSAGPNGIVDTPAWATETRGDDVGYRTK